MKENGDDWWCGWGGLMTPCKQLEGCDPRGSSSSRDWSVMVISVQSDQEEWIPDWPKAGWNGHLLVESMYHPVGLDLWRALLLNSLQEGLGDGGGGGGGTSHTYFQWFLIKHSVISLHFSPYWQATFFLETKTFDLYGAMLLICVQWWLILMQWSLVSAILWKWYRFLMTSNVGLYHICTAICNSQ